MDATDRQVAPVKGRPGRLARQGAKRPATTCRKSLRRPGGAGHPRWQRCGDGSGPPRRELTRPLQFWPADSKSGAASISVMVRPVPARDFAQLIVHRTGSDGRRSGEADPDRSSAPGRDERGAAGRGGQQLAADGAATRRRFQAGAELDEGISQARAAQAWVGQETRKRWLRPDDPDRGGNRCCRYPCRRVARRRPLLSTAEGDMLIRAPGTGGMLRRSRARRGRAVDGQGLAGSTGTSPGKASSTLAGWALAPWVPCVGVIRRLLALLGVLFG